MSDDADNEASKLAKLWLDYAALLKPDDEKSHEDHSFWDAYFEFRDPFDPARPTPPDVWWEFILAAMENEHSDVSLATFAAGPMEDFLVLYGDSMIEQVEAEASRSPIFQRAVSGVWRNRMSENVWTRIQALKAAATVSGNSLD